MTDFAEEARQALRDLVARYGTELIDEPRRVQALLRDVAGGYRREVSALVVAAEEGVGAALFASSDSLGPATAGRLARRLQSDRALTEDAAQWAVESWAIALGVRITAAPQPDATPIPPPVPPPDSPQARPPPVAATSPARESSPVPKTPTTPQPTPRPPAPRFRMSIGAIVGAVGGIVALVAVILALGGGSDEPTSSGVSTTTPTTVRSTTEPPPTSEVTTSSRPPSTSTTSLPPTTTSPTATTATTVGGAIVAVSSQTGTGIVDRGSVSIGIHNLDIPPFKAGDGQDLIGFEIDIARELVVRLFGDVDVEWVPLSAADRFAALDDGTVDMLVRNTSHTTSREALAAFTSPYFLDGPGLLVRRDGPVLSSAGGPEVALESLIDGRIGVLAGTSTELALRTALANDGIDAEVVLYESVVPIVVANGEVDAYATSFMGALVAVANDPSLEALLIGFEEPIAVAVGLGDGEFRDEVDVALQSMVFDGTLELFYLAYIGGNVPWTSAELLEFPPIDR